METWKGEKSGQEMRGEERKREARKREVRSQREEKRGEEERKGERSGEVVKQSKHTLHFRTYKHRNHDTSLYPLMQIHSPHIHTPTNATQ